MNVGIFTDTYKPDLNGCAQSAEVLNNNLSKLGINVYVICAGKDLKIQREGNVLRLPGIMIKKFYEYKISSPLQPLYLDEIKKLDLDIVHAETEFGIGILANIVAFSFKIPLVRTYHTDYLDYTNYFIDEDIPLIYSTAKNIVSNIIKVYGDHCLRLMTPSNKTKETLLKTGIKTPIVVIPNGIELDRFNKTNVDKKKIAEIRKKYANNKLLVYVGRIADEKRVDLLIRVFKKIKEENLNIKLLIVGHGPSLNKNIKLVNSLKLDDYVFFEGKVENELVPIYYCAADAFISASTSETQGLTYIEALASSTPIIVAYDDVLKELVCDGKNGYFFNDEVDCYKKIKEFSMLNDNKIGEMEDYAYKTSMNYDAINFANSTIKVYSDVIEEFKNSYIIDKTTLKDDVVVLSISNKVNNKLKLTLSLDDYYNYGFRNNSLINLKTIEDFKKKELSVLAYHYALKRLSTKDYSIKKMKESILNKYSLNDKEIDNIIKQLVDNKLLNDKKYAASKIDFLSLSLLSTRAIKHKLLKDGISSDIIDSCLVVNEQEELLKAKKKAKHYNHLIKGKSVNLKKQTILNKLINDGFNLTDAKEAVDDLDLYNDLISESELLKIESQKCYLKYRKKYKGTELRNRIFSHLIQKGFSYESIYAVINEMEY